MFSVLKGFHSFKLKIQLFINSFNQELNDLFMVCSVTSKLEFGIKITKSAYK